MTAPPPPESPPPRPPPSSTGPAGPPAASAPTATSTATPAPALPVPAVSRRRWRPSLVWLVPGVAALVGLAMLVQYWMTVGPEITIRFRTAAGLEAGKTPVKYRDLTVGTVKELSLSPDGKAIIARVALIQGTQGLTREDTRYWVVRPRVGTSGVSGFDTLLSGAYIAADAGNSPERRTEFVGLETPPTIIAGMPGKRFVLRAEDLGSLDIGSSVYFRRVPVGRVASYNLLADGSGVELEVFVDAPYDAFVGDSTRFWNASGVDVTLGADGLQLKTQSIATIIAGGIAFAQIPGRRNEPAAEGSVFKLARDISSAMAPPDGPAQFMLLRFADSLRGLSVGAPVQFAGIDAGKVVSIELDYDPKRRRFPTVVGIVVYPHRLGRVLDKLPPFDGDDDRQAGEFLRGLVDQGLRGQAKTGNLLTGQLYIALDFVANAPKVAFNPEAKPLELPTASSGFDQLQEQIGNIVTRVEKLPIDSIAINLDRTLERLGRTLDQVNTQFLPSANRTLEQLMADVLPETTRTLAQARRTLGDTNSLLGAESPLQEDLGRTLGEVQRTMRSVRGLTDMLGRHPDALLRGVPDSPSPLPESGR